MAIINHDYKDVNFLENIITDNEGKPLHGEIDVYRRIMSDFANSNYQWHFWHDLNLPIPVKDQGKIQIDFLLACELGVIIIEVKGGVVGINMGKYYLQYRTKREYLNRSPFEQADDYMHALMNNNVIPSRELFLTTACAFPHTKMDHTSDNDEMDLGWKLWSKYDQDSDYSFEDFCIDVIKKSKAKSHYPDYARTPQQVIDALQHLLFNYSDNSKSYTKASLKSILEWLKIDSLSIFNSLKKNKRIVIEGGPGTGKTTLAKAFIKQNKDVHGIYLCWNKLLEAKIRHDLSLEGLNKCEVYNYASFLLSLQKKCNQDLATLEDINAGNQKVLSLLETYRKSGRFSPYCYIVVDEAQDVFDKGLTDVLDKMFAVDGGLFSGSYMVFYDTEQGFNSKNRPIEKFAQIASRHSAIFELDDNKRVPPSKKIATFASSLLSGETAATVIENIEKEELEYMPVRRFKGVKTLNKHLSGLCEDIYADGEQGEYVILAHSSTQREDVGASVYNRIESNFEQLTENNVFRYTQKIKMTSILKFKGLECNNVMLILDSRNYIDNYELYIGLTRAIESVSIFIIE